MAESRTTKNIFISYRHQEPDRGLAHYFADTLRAAEHEVLIDTGLRWGNNWVRGIEEALRRCDFLLLLLSPEAAQSEMVIEEVAIAKELARNNDGRPTVLPLRVAYPFSDSLPYHLSAYLRDIHQQSWSGPHDTPIVTNMLLEVIGTNSSLPAPSEAIGETAAPSEIPLPFADPTGGAIELDSESYIARHADEQVLMALRVPRTAITVKGPRQSGKTSLLIRIEDALKQVDETVATAFVDFQLLTEDAYTSPETLWRAIADEVAYTLDLDDWEESKDRATSNYQRLLDRFLDRYVFKSGAQRLVFCFDEVDRIFSHDIKTAFFASVRGLYNRGATDRSWKKVSWVLGTSSEPILFIEDLSQSPFNIGLRVELDPFTQEEVGDLARRFGIQADAARLQRILDYVGGRPYLIHLLLYHLRLGERTEEALFNEETAGDNIFRV